MLKRVKIINNLRFKVFVLFMIAFLPRVIGLGEHDIFVDEISWMSRAKDVYAAVRTLSWNPYNVIWWLNEGAAEALGLPVTFLGGVSITFLSPGYSHYSLNITRDFIAARFPVILIGSLFVPLFYLLLRKFIGDKLAFIVSLLLAIDPIAIALSRWFQQDMALLAFSSLSIFLYLYSKRKIVVASSAFFAAMAILTKPQGFLVVVTLVFLSIIAFLTKRKAYVGQIASWLLLVTLFTVLFFPYLWSSPVGNMFQYLSVQLGNVNGGNLTFFNGHITSNPPWYYYFAIFPFRVPESILIGFLVGLAVLLVSLKWGVLRNYFVLAVLIYSILFILVISFSNKKLGIRYLFGIWPYIYIVAAYGLVYLEKLIRKPFRKIFWLGIFLFPVWGIIKFYPSYYLFYNHFITPSEFQSLESVGYCDSVRPAIEYLGPGLYHGIKIMLRGCDSAINYYTGFTITRVNSISDRPDYVIEETINLQKFPEIAEDLRTAGYKEIKQVDFAGLVLANIYQKP